MAHERRADPLPQGYLQQSKDPYNSFVLVLPLLLVYQAGLFLSGGATANGADLTLLAYRVYGIEALLIFNGVLIVGGLVALGVLRHQGRFHPRIAWNLVAESTFYALLMGVSISLVLNQILPQSTGQPGESTLGLLCLALGAGVNEEFVFRLGLFGGIAWLLAKPLDKKAAVALALVVSSVLFSLAHFVDPSEPRTLDRFLFRFLAGAFFCGLYCLRGFAVSVYTHAIYDVLVMVVLSPEE